MMMNGKDLPGLSKRYESDREIQYDSLDNKRLAAARILKKTFSSSSTQLQQEEITLQHQEEDDFEYSFRPSLKHYDLADVKYMAQLAEKVENYDDMRIFMKRIAMSKEVLTEQERVLLSTAYKNVVGKIRSSWRVIYEMGEKEVEEATEAPDDGKNTTSSLPMEGCGPFSSMNNIPIDLENHDFGRANESDGNSPLELMTRVVRSELHNICLEFIFLVKRLVLQETVPEAIVYYKKLVADYFRYLSEYTSEDSRREFSKEAGRMYVEALELSSTSLPPAHPLRLGLALNASVFYFEITDTPDKACELAKTTYDSAVASLQDESQKAVAPSKEVMLLLDLLRENLTIWTLTE